MNYYKIATGIITAYVMCETIEVIENVNCINVNKWADIRISSTQNEHEVHNRTKQLEFKPVPGIGKKIQVLTITEEEFTKAFNTIEAFELAKAKINQTLFVDCSDL